MTNEPTNGSLILSRRIYSVAQITLATWAASPLAGCLLLSFNYRTLPKTSSGLANARFGLSNDGSCVCFHVPLSTQISENDFAISIRGRYVAFGLPSPGVKQQKIISRPVAKGSWWTTFGLSVGIVLSIFVLLVAGLMTYQYLGCYYRCR